MDHKNGASKDDLKELESNITHYAQLIQKITGSDVFSKENYGAAGGIPLSACELLGAEVVSGSDLIFDTLGLSQVIASSDVVITGEGKIDHQTTQGKAISPIVNDAIGKQKTLFLVCGVFENDGDKLLESLKRFELAQLAQKLKKDSFQDASELCYEVGKRIGMKLKHQ